MHIEILHSTRLEYDREAQPQSHLLYLRPRQNPLLQVNRFELRFTPSASVHWMRDDFDNLLASARFSDTASLVEIRSICTVNTSDLPPFDFWCATTHAHILSLTNRSTISISGSISRPARLRLTPLRDRAISPRPGSRERVSARAGFCDDSINLMVALGRAAWSIKNRRGIALARAVLKRENGA